MMEWWLVLAGLLFVVGFATGTILHMLFVAIMLGIMVGVLAMMGVSLGGFVLFMIACTVGAVVLVLGIGFMMTGSKTTPPKAPPSTLVGDDRFIHDKVCAACSKRMMRAQMRCPHCGVDAP